MVDTTKYEGQEKNGQKVPLYKDPKVIAAIIGAIAAIAAAFLAINQSPLIININQSQSGAQGNIINSQITGTQPPAESTVVVPIISPTSVFATGMPQIDFGHMRASFDINEPIYGKRTVSDVLGVATEYNSLNFIVTAKNDFYNVVIFEAQFFDEGGIKIYSSFVEFDPAPLQWKQGEKSRGYILLPDSPVMEKVRLIKISGFSG